MSSLQKYFMLGIVYLMAFSTSGNLYATDPETIYPGNVSTNLKLWLKADVSGAAFPAQWDGQSNLSADAFTVHGNPVLQSSQFNHNRVANFTDDRMEFIRDGLENDFHYYIVFSTTQSSSTGNQFWQNPLLIGGDAGTNDFGLGLRGNSISFGEANDAVTNAGTPVNHGRPVLAVASRNKTSAMLTLRLNGNNEATAGGYDRSYTDLGVYSIGRHPGLNSQFNGQIAEIIAYGDVLSGVEQQKVESYLALKYGITLSTDYIASDGTKMWSTTKAGTYIYNVAGIGRDDGSLLGQVKSTSQNADAIITMTASGEGTNQSPTFSDIANNEYLTWSHNNAAINWTNANIHEGYKRLERTWLVQETGDITKVSISVNAGNGVLPGSSSGEYYVIIDSDNDGDFTDHLLLKMSDDGMGNDEVAGDNIYTVGEYDFQDGDKFTIATAIVAPGGVEGDQTVWFRADAGTFIDGGTITSTNGQNIQQWNNLVGNTDLQELTQGDGNRKPLYLDETMNFNPTLKFDGGDILGNHININAVTDGTRLSSFVVAKIDNNWGMLYGWQSHSTTNKLVVESPGTFFYGNNNSITPHPMTQDKTELVSFVRSDGINKAYLNSLLTGQNNTDNIPSHSANFEVGGFRGSPMLNGSIAEVIIYDESLDDTKKLKIESYLALKYGITLDQTAPTNYVASDGTLMWSATKAGDYKYNIAGIGRDDNSKLGQVKSKSENDDAVIAMLAEDEGTNLNNSFTDMDNLEFLSWSHNNQSLTWTAANAPAGLQTIDRSWKVQKAGHVGTVTFMVDNRKGTLPGAIGSSYYLLFDADRDGNFAEEVPVPLYDDGTNGDEVAFDGIYSINGVNFSGGDIFTIASKSIAPGGVSGNQTVWFKADAGTFKDGGATSANYGDQLQQWNNLIANDKLPLVQQNNAVNKPDYLNNLINYNPALKFNKSENDILQSIDEIELKGVTQGKNLSTFVIAKLQKSPGQGNAWGMLYSYQSHDNTNKLAIQSDGTYFYGGTNQITNHPMSTDVSEMISFIRDGSLENNKGFVNSKFIEQTTTDNIALHDAWFEVGGFRNKAEFTGDIAEIIVFDATLNPIEQLKVESYLALKYGITIDQTVAKDYIASDGLTKMWTAATANHFNHDIAGIGRDDCSELGQVKSKSENKDAIITMMAEGEGTNDNNLFTTIEDREFLTWSNDNGTNDWQSDDVPDNYFRLNRRWKVQETGEVGFMSIMVDANNPDFLLPAIPGGSKYYILFDTDQDEIFGDELAPVLQIRDDGVGGDEVAGDGIYTAVGIDLPHEVNFTIATEAIEIPPVPDGMALWVRADKDAIGGATINLWKDQSGNNHHATQSNAGRQPILALESMNYNPVVIFDESDEGFMLPDNLIGTGQVAYDLIVVGFSNSHDPNETKDLFHFGDLMQQNRSMEFGYSYWGDQNRKLLGHFNANAFTSGVVIEENIPNLVASDNDKSTRKMYKDGKEVASKGDGGHLNLDGSVNTLGNSFRFTNGLYGGMAEAMAFTRKLTPLEKQKVNSYLALKYGITLDQSVPVSYLAGDGATLMWDAGLAAVYNNDIAGVGKDNTFLLNQLKSKSQNADGILSIEVPALNEKEFFTWANNNGNNVWTSSGAQEGDYIIGRQWKTQEHNGDVGKITIAFDVSDPAFDIPNVAVAGHKYSVLYDDNGNGSLADETPIELFDDGTNGDAVAGDNIFTTNTINLKHNTIFTIASAADPDEEPEDPSGGDDSCDNEDQEFKPCSNKTFYVEEGVYYDCGGKDANYGNDDCYTVTFHPNAKDKVVEMTFRYFETADCEDALQILDGPNVYAPLIGRYCGVKDLGTIQSTHSSGALTFIWESNSSGTKKGWKACISTVSNQLRINAGEDKTICKSCTATLGGAPTTSGGIGDPENYTYSWSPAAGLLDPANVPNPRVKPDASTTYTLTVTDAEGNTTTDEVYISIFDQGDVTSPEVEIGDKLSISDGVFETNPNLPIDRRANYTVSEQVYYQSEIGQSGPITQLAFYKPYADGHIDITNAKVYMKHTNATTLEAVNSWNESGYQLVFDGTINNNINQRNWVNIPLDKPFIYNGTDNLQIAVVHGFQQYTNEYIFSEGWFTWSYPQWSISYTSEARARYGTAYENFPGGLLPNIADGQYYRNDIKLTFQQVEDKAHYYACEDNVIQLNEGLFTNCGGVFENYQPNENYRITFVPEDNHKFLKASFDYLQLGIGDVLKVYDGPDENYPIIGIYDEYNLPGALLATNIAGALTFRFTSNEDENTGNWKAWISYANEPLTVDAGTDKNSCHNCSVTLGGVPAASGGKSRVYEYNWYKDEVLVSNFANPTIYITGTEGDVLTYRLEVKNTDPATGTVETATDEVTITLAPAINNISLGGGTLATSQVPLNRTASYAKTEMIYYQQDINYAGYITSIQFNKTSGHISPIENVEIYMKESEATEVQEGYLGLHQYTNVFSGTIQNDVTTGWITIQLDEPFAYNNTGNLHIAMIQTGQTVTQGETPVSWQAGPAIPGQIQSGAGESSEVDMSHNTALPAVVVNVDNGVPPNTTKGNYTQLRNKLDGAMRLTDKYGRLYFIYNERYNPGVQALLNYTIYNKNRVPIGTLPIRSVKTGENYYELDLTNYCTEGELYVLEVTGVKGHKQYVKFKYHYNPFSFQLAQ